MGNDMHKLQVTEYWHAAHRGRRPCAQGGLAQATKLARDMVTRYGMSDVLGLTSIDYEDGRSLSGETRALVEREVHSCAKKCLID